ncbi:MULTISPECIES: putative toxin-antitoxin system toxin component, PIN family [unclassified Duganella]|jgi:putative PIN family toxin of toxin-antitoxin system|uniref:putative toxin-antitoxin system toxin component, PIN family n=1 Tax=unclassified Duganella TaxID=2636909 RepID=UPI000B7C8467|nr:MULTISPECIES: putative toxin-antitoxin system toxin component, PIN family [unclassified Duganella]
MRLVLDTNVVVSAFVAQGAPHHLLQMAARNHIAICASVELLSELKVVLGRKRIVSRLQRMQRHPDEVMRKYTAISSIVRAPPPYPHIARDPKDDMVLACALAAKATAIVTGDNDLLVIQQYQGMQILRPRQALQKVMFRTGFP